MNFNQPNTFLDFDKIDSWFLNNFSWNLTPEKLNIMIMREIEKLYLKPSSFLFDLTHKLAILNFYFIYIIFYFSLYYIYVVLVISSDTMSHLMWGYVIFLFHWGIPLVSNYNFRYLIKTFFALLRKKVKSTYNKTILSVKYLQTSRMIFDVDR